MAFALTAEILDGVWSLGDAGVDYYFTREAGRVIQEHGTRYISRKVKQKALEYGYTELKKKLNPGEEEEEESITAGGQQGTPASGNQHMPANPQVNTRTGAGIDVPGAGMSGANSSATVSSSKPSDGKVPSDGGGGGEAAAEPSSGFTSASGYSVSQNHAIHSRMYSKNFRHYLTYHEQEGWKHDGVQNGTGDYPIYSDSGTRNADWVSTTSKVIELNVILVLVAIQLDQLRYVDEGIPRIERGIQ